MSRIICLAIGYVFGLFQTGYIYGKLHDVDIRSKGSGNSGSTNVLRVMGVKAGAIVFCGDFFKTLIPCLLVNYFFGNQQEITSLMVLYTAFGVILGHNYPFYMNFKGGKGIAATVGLIAAMDLRVLLMCAIAFILVVAVTRFVSLGSLVMAVIFLISMIVFGSRGDYELGSNYLTEFYIVAACVSGMAFWRHRSNIVRLIQGNENKVGSKKQ